MADRPADQNQRTYRRFYVHAIQLMTTICDRHAGIVRGHDKLHHVRDVTLGEALARAHPKSFRLMPACATLPSLRCTQTAPPGSAGYPGAIPQLHPPAVTIHSHNVHTPVCVTPPPGANLRGPEVGTFDSGADAIQWMLALLRENETPGFQRQHPDRRGGGYCYLLDVRVVYGAIRALHASHAARLRYF